MTYNELWHLLAPLYGDGEAKAIARMVYDVRFGLSLSDIYIGKDTQLSANSQAELRRIAERLLQQEPVQYVLGQADFCGRTFLVNKHVLIPRPETEELCQWVASLTPSSLKGKEAKLLDIGTGSGCIAITLASMYPKAKVTAWDISREALGVAHENARRQNVNVTLEQVDALNISHISQWDLIISNPPYICRKEAALMESNVLDHEPHEALFVPDEEPLLFYEAIGKYAQQGLKQNGLLAFEINPLYANQLSNTLSDQGFHDISIVNDSFGKQRFILCYR